MASLLSLAPPPARPSFRFKENGFHINPGTPLAEVVIDYVPRKLTAEQHNALQALERQVAAQLELRRNLEELRVALEGITSLSALIPFCSTCALNIVIPADPAAVPSPVEGDNLLKASGPGVFLINQLMDTVEYTQQGRTLSMRKHPTPS